MTNNPPTKQLVEALRESAEGFESDAVRLESDSPTASLLTSAADTIERLQSDVAELDQIVGILLGEVYLKRNGGERLPDLPDLPDDHGVLIATTLGLIREAGIKRAARAFREK